MKVLFFSPSFYPQIGGLETVSMLIAKTLAKKKIDVVVITYAALDNHMELDEGFKILRNPSSIVLFKEHIKADIFFHHNVSLKGVWPLLLYPKKWVILHHLTYFNIRDKLAPLEWLKRNLSRFGNNVSVSCYVNHTLPKRGNVIYNPYDDEVFYLRPEIKRDKSFLFVGRLVSDKGCALLIEAFYQNKEKGFTEKLSIVGDGPELAFLKEKVKKFGLEESITFMGTKQGNELAEIYNQHHTLVIPSIWKEPFGLIALEGLACGCQIICSDGDGLQEASLGFGAFFKKKNINSLANSIINETMKDQKIDFHKVFTELQKYNKNSVGTHWLNYLNKLYEN
jgi:glycogen(starch) synthase